MKKHCILGISKNNRFFCKNPFYRIIDDKYPESTKDEILFIGDTYETDITGAHNAGLKAAWINRQKASDIYGFASYQINDVTGILNICISS